MWVEAGGQWLVGRVGGIGGSGGGGGGDAGGRNGACVNVSCLERHAAEMSCQQVR